MQVEGHQASGLPLVLATGARVSNAYRTCPALRDSPLKGGLRPDALWPPPGGLRKGLPARDGDASH